MLPSSGQQNVLHEYCWKWSLHSLSPAEFSEGGTGVRSCWQNTWRPPDCCLFPSASIQVRTPASCMAGPSQMWVTPSLSNLSSQSRDVSSIQLTFIWFQACLNSLKKASKSLYLNVNVWWNWRQCSSTHVVPKQTRHTDSTAKLVHVCYVICLLA